MVIMSYGGIDKILYRKFYFGILKISCRHGDRSNLGNGPPACLNERGMSSTSPGGWAGCSSLTKAKKNKGPGAWAWEALSKRPARPTSTIVESRVTASTGKEGVVHMSCRVRPPGAADGTRTCVDFVHVSIPPFAAWRRRQDPIEGCLVFFVREAIECLEQWPLH